VIQSGLALSLPEALFDVPAASRDPGQAGCAGAAGPEAGVCTHPEATVPTRKLMPRPQQKQPAAVRR
jgi:hypothetical protein